MNPKHKNPTKFRTDKNNRFEYWAHAPYNFVPLPEQVVTAGSVPNQNSYSGYTGYIHCTLTTKTPLYVRAMMTQEDFAKYGETGIGDLLEELERLKRKPASADNDVRIHELERIINVRAQFFSVLDHARPLIPGSSLRGMIRSLVEIISYSKIQPVTRTPLIFRAVGDTSKLGTYYRERLMQEDSKNYFTPKMQAGYLHQRGKRWEIQPTQVIGGVSFARIHHDVLRAMVQSDPSAKPTREEKRQLLAQAIGQLTQIPNCKNARDIWAKLGKYDYQPVREGVYHIKYTPVLSAQPAKTPGHQKMVLAISGPIDKKQREAVVFPEDTSATPIQIDDAFIQAYREQISPEQVKLLGVAGVLNEGQPVFYLIENDKLVFFGHVMLFRLPYHASPHQFVPEKLRAENQIDFAEALFGFVPRDKDDKRGARAGRVFFTDATTNVTGANVWLTQSPLTPKILASPKPTTFQHYLTQQEPDAVQVGTNKNGTPRFETRLDHYASPPPHQTVIRGHKIYWHHGRIGKVDIEEANTQNIREHPKQYTRMMPVNENVQFEFDIHFENLADYELGALLWALRLPPQHYHELGMGKPLGMGAVEIQPTVYLRDRVSRYQTLFEHGAWNLGQAQVIDENGWRAAFENYILARIDPVEKGNAQCLADLERIRMLLKLMEWSGPDRSLTDYMPIQPNEFRERPVLPDPTHITLPSVPSKPPSHHGRPPQRNRPTTPNK